MKKQISFYLWRDVLRAMRAALRKINRGKRGQARMSQSQFIAEAVQRKADEVLSEPKKDTEQE